MLLPLIIAVCLAGSLISVLAAASYLLLPDTVRARTLESLVSFATGMLLGTAFLHLIPRALEHEGAGGPEAVTATLLAATCGFFLLEKGLIWRHHHHHGHEGHDAHDGVRRSGALILVGDSVHNFVDGVLISAAFISDVRLGVVTAVAAIAHEIPQELGDFAILLNSGFSRRRAFLLNALTALTTVAGALLTYVGMREVSSILPYVLAVAAASFIYIAVADLMPALNRRVGGRAALSQLLLLGAGIALTALIASYHGS